MKKFLLILCLIAVCDAQAASPPEWAIEFDDIPDIREMSARLSAEIEELERLEASGDYDPTARLIYEREFPDGSMKFFVTVDGKQYECDMNGRIIEPKK